MQFAGAVKEPQVCSGVRFGDKVTPSLTQLLSELFAMIRQLIFVFDSLRGCFTYTIV